MARLCSVHMSTVPCVRLGTALEHPSAEHVRVALVCGPRLFSPQGTRPNCPSRPRAGPGPRTRLARRLGRSTVTILRVGRLLNRVTAVRGLRGRVEARERHGVRREMPLPRAPRQAVLIGGGMPALHRSREWADAT